jgi:hypothetical protein
MSLQRFTIGHVPGLAKIVHGTIAMLRFSKVVRGTTAPLAPCGLERMTMQLSTPTLISNQVVPYRTRDGTYCPRVSTPKIQFLTNLSKTNHKS